jgi:hypothetical protein
MRWRDEGRSAGARVGRSTVTRPSPSTSRARACSRRRARTRTPRSPGSAAQPGPPRSRGGADMPVGRENPPELRMDLVLLAGHDHKPVSWSARRLPRRELHRGQYAMPGSSLLAAPQSSCCVNAATGISLVDLVADRRGILYSSCPNGRCETTSLRRLRQCAWSGRSAFLQVHRTT